MTHDTALSKHSSTSYDAALKFLGGLMKKRDTVLSRQSTIGFDEMQTRALVCSIKWPRESL
jgi:hypothetical protein